MALCRAEDAPFSYCLRARTGTDAGKVAESCSFRVTAALAFTKARKADSHALFFYWAEPTDPAVFWEFVPAARDTSPTTTDMFQMAVAQCVYEHEQQRSQQSATDADLQPFLHTDEGDAGGGDQALAREQPLPDASSVTFRSAPAGFYVFDPSSNMFVQKEAGLVRLLISSAPQRPFEYVLHVVRAEDDHVCHWQRLDADATQHLDRASRSFIWCCFTDGARIWTYSLRFADTPAVLAAAHAYNQAAYEALNREKWGRLGAGDAAYLLDPMLDIDMADASDLPVERDLGGDESGGESGGEGDGSGSGSGSETEGEGASDSDSGHRRTRTRTHTHTTRTHTHTPEEQNQMLAVGFRTDRSFVSRGAAVEVFRHDADDRLGRVGELKVQDLQGRAFTPTTRMMLHQEDQSLLLMNAADQHRIYRMDLNRGAVVDEWLVHADAPITAIAPDSKYAQLTGQATFIGLNSSALFRVDPRLPGSKRVESETKSYAVRNQFSCAATTGAGEVAVASAKGEIRLFNRLDRRAKTLLPMFGDAIIGIDVTESGRYLLATCRAYLLLICTELEPGGALGFSTPMGARKPTPRRLQLRPEHVAFMGAPPAFTPARFSTGQAEERAIITSTGPFVITWNLRRVKQGHLYDYQIKRYDDRVVADNFRFGHDRSIVVAFPEHVSLLSKRSLGAPSPRTLGRDL